jgi:hypothetical protein
MTTKLPDGFVLVTELRVMERKEEPVYEPERKDIWILFGCWAVSMVFAGFFAYGVWKAFELFLQKVGLGG